MRKYQEIAKPEKKPKKKKIRIAMKVLSVLMPYLLSIAFVVVLFSLFGFLDIKKGEETIKIGSALIAPLKVMFSASGTIFITLALIYHALVWKYDVKHKICVRRVICTIFTAIFISSIQHLIEYDNYHVPYDSLSSIFDIGRNGLDMHGGGIFGALLGDFLRSATHEFIAYAILLVLLLFLFLQMFNITPVTMVQALFAKMKRKPKDGEEEKENKPKKEKAPKPVKGKKVDVYDDGKDYVEKEAEKRLVQAAKKNPNVGVDLRELIMMKDDGESHESVEGEYEKYESFDDQLVNSRGTASDQLKPYDEEYIRERKEIEESMFASSTPIDTDEYGHVLDEDESEEAPTRSFDSLDEYFAMREAEEGIVSKEPEKKEESLFTDSYLEKNNKVDEPVIEEADDDFEIEKYAVSSISSFDFNPQREQMVDVPAADEVEEKPQLVPYVEGMGGVQAAASLGMAAATAIETSESAQSIAPAPIAPVVPVAPEAPVDEFGYLDELIDNAKKTIDPNKAAETLNNDFVDNSNCIPLDHMGTKKAPQQPPKKKAIKRNYKFPPIQYLQEPVDNSNSAQVKAELQENAKIIVETLNEFKTWTKVSDITRGPTVTRYELVPEPGVRVRSIASLSDDIKLKLAAEDIRMECPVPGKSAVGIEVPNKVTSLVYLRDLIDCQQFKKAKGKLTCALGKSIAGENIYVDIEKTPHLLVAGATGMGKSVCINSLLVSLLYRATPDDVRLILVDPKKVELSNYNGVPHLLVPVVVEPKKALGALQWAVTEMENRFETIEAAGVRNLIEFNEKVEKGYDADKMSRIVIVIDELADLKMQVPDIDQHITRLTQKARAAGIHIIIGTQRPSVDVITGLIKSNIPSRISFRVPSQIDSRTVLDEVGAERLVSRGDMLVKIVGSLYPVRVQGSFVSADEIEEVINFWKENTPAIYDEDVMHQIDANAAKIGKSEKGSSSSFDDDDGDGGELDSSFYDALELATEMGKISSSFLQRKLRLGFQRAARIIDQMEECGYIGEQNGSKPRDVLITKDDFHEIMMRRQND
ncbi:MAG: DNA translocase FtsK [Clostridia bacterium]|nr:DNA translocase FtsK [Clostridia bacterium]